VRNVIVAMRHSVTRNVRHGDRTIVGLAGISTRRKARFSLVGGR
jgi:hypothetical protein